MPLQAWGAVTWRPFAWRFIAWMVGLSLVAHVWGERAVTHVLPALQAEIAWLDDTYDVRSLTLDTEGADHVVRLLVSQRHYIQLAGRLFEPNPLGRANASTLVGHLILPVVVLVGVVLAWPARSLGAWWWRWPKLLSASALLVALNVPLVLWAGIWHLHVDAFAPETWSPLLVWADFLQAGGEHVLALLLAALCLAPKPSRHEGQC